MKNTFSRKFTVCALAGVLGFAFSACDDSSSAGGDDGETSVLSSSAKVTEPAEGSSSSVEKGQPDSDAKSSSSTKENKDSSDSKSSSSVKVSALSSSSVALATPCKTETEDSCEYGTLNDERDGQIYKTVKIGDQWWMAENLNYETDNSFCYNDSAEYCEKYGRLYTWAAAMDSAGTWSTNGKGCGYNKTCSPTYPVRGVCPDGWHLPSQTERNTLITAVGGSSVAGTKLKSTSGWYNNGNGTDAFSFSALPAGGRDYNDEGYTAYFWSSTENGSYYAFHMCFDYYYDNAVLGSHYKNYGKSVRCIKDSE